MKQDGIRIKNRKYFAGSSKKFEGGHTLCPQKFSNSVQALLFKSYPHILKKIIQVVEC
jgi:hypothetical protein